ncbi:ethylbenzene dehydrogenase-related protein [Candidatus Methanoperedens nitratireducens]|uniref:Ethylbenzene dehydrogenase n=1 Tax=Candidatus Methanoperedens nitratireducens TaxID=1392998 RepID=A0A284VQ00_9EURY|nr:ethylbenzene dehydrogenase-related protein [Candidatus Methanoperedens nitroreducens]SNQ61273.1 Ethylbenzene dehydrogenase [Candidatus Methanoperedens nitroreducens]
MKRVNRRVTTIANKFLILGFIALLSFSIGVGAAETLTSVNVSTAPVIDGIPESIWDQANPISINVSGGFNNSSTTVILKSIYTNDSVYFLAQWADPTQSLRREPWVKQPNGSWIQLKDPNDTGGDNNQYYEDKFAQIWNINTSAFEASGCFALCHAGEAGKPYGNKYTPNTSETADLWHMKIVRTNPTGYIDDQYVDSTRYNVTSAPEAGRKSDPGLVPYYTNGLNASTKTPNFTSADQPAQINKTYWILDDLKQPFNDTYAANDEIAAIIARPPTDDRADIRGKAVYTDGNWTMEYGRKLTTGSQYDVQFSDLQKEYTFGTAIFDNAQVRHSYASGVSKLVFTEATTPAATTVAPTPTEAPGVTVTVSQPYP